MKVKEDCKKCGEECTCSQDAYLYDSSTFSLENEDDSVLCGYGYQESLNNDAIQGKL